MKLKLPRLLIAFACLACWSSVAAAQIELQRPKPELPLPNPYTINVPREKIIEAAQEIFKACAIQINEEASRPADGKLVTKPLVYTKGVTARSDLEYLSNPPASDVRNWIQGRYSLEINALPVDGKRSQIQVTAHIQGRISGILSDEKWIDSPSNGRLEDEVLRGLSGKILGLDMSVKGARPGQRRLLNCEY
jgi:hypothetical protein